MMLRADSWFCTQESLSCAGDHVGCQGLNLGYALNKVIALPTVLQSSPVCTFKSLEKLSAVWSGLENLGCVWVTRGWARRV